MRVICSVEGEIDCKYMKKCKDYKKCWILGQTQSRCMRCKNNKNAKVEKNTKKSYFESM